MSDFGIYILTIFLAPQCSKEQDLNNGTTPSQIGPRVPSGLILQENTFSHKNLLMFFIRALFICKGGHFRGALYITEGILGLLLEPLFCF